jgi:hypothetical protein
MSYSAFRRFIALLLGSALCLACGPALVEQRRLNSIGDRAVADCRAQNRRVVCKADAASPACIAATAKCQVALACVQAVAKSNADTQAVQQSRATVGSTLAQEELAKDSYKSAVDSCAQGGWRWPG